MDERVVVRICQLLRFVMFDFGKDKGGERGGLRGGGCGMFGEDRGIVRDT